jgi:hypothetical protein
VAPVVTVQGLRDFRAALKAAGENLPKELRLGLVDVAKIAERVSIAEANRMGGIQKKASRAIKGTATQREARVQINKSKAKSNPTAFANIAFWGAKKRTGWYAADKYQQSKGRQHPPWVGNTWEVLNPTQGPYALNAALARHEDDIMAALTAALDRLIAQAFPD